MKKYKSLLLEILSKYTALRFVISGGTAGFVDLVFLYIFNSFFNINYLLSAIVAFIIAFFVSFTLHKFWTFRSYGGRSSKQVIMYLGTSLFGLIFNTVLMYVFVGILNIQVILSQIFAGSIVAFSSFFISRNFVFVKGNSEIKI